MAGTGDEVVLGRSGDVKRFSPTLRITGLPEYFSSLPFFNPLAPSFKHVVAEILFITSFNQPHHRSLLASITHF
jgi:hypothetical protein